MHNFVEFLLVLGLVHDDQSVGFIGASYCDVRVMFEFLGGFLELWREDGWRVVVSAFGAFSTQLISQIWLNVDYVALFEVQQRAVELFQFGGLVIFVELGLEMAFGAKVQYRFLVFGELRSRYVYVAVLFLWQAYVAIVQFVQFCGDLERGFVFVVLHCVLEVCC